MLPESAESIAAYTETFTDNAARLTAVGDQRSAANVLRLG